MNGPSVQNHQDNSLCPRLGGGHFHKLCTPLGMLLLCLVSLSHFAAFLQGQETSKTSPAELLQLIDQHYERLYLPESELPRLWTAQEGVLMEQQKFAQLLQQANLPTPEEVSVPEGFFLNNIQYQVQWREDLLEIEARCLLEKKKTGWAHLRLPLENITLKQALLNGKPAPLGNEENTSAVILLDDFVGQQELILTLSTPLQRSGSEMVGLFTIFPQAAAMLTTSVPAGKVLQWNGQSVTGAENQQEVRQQTLAVGGASQIHLRLTDAKAESLEESLVFARTHYALQLEPQQADWRADCQITVFGKSFQQLTFEIPGQLQLTEVRSPHLRSWELTEIPDQPERTRVQLTFQETLPARTSLIFQGIQQIDNSENWTIAALSLPGAASHTGQVMLSVPTSLRSQTLEMQEIRPALESAVPSFKIVTPEEQRRSFEFWRESFVLRQKNSPKTRQVQAAVSHILELQEWESQLTSVVTLETFFEPLFEIEVDLPADWQPERIHQQTGELDWQKISQEAGKHRLKIILSPPLKPGERRTLWLTTRFQQERTEQATGERTFELPEPQLKEIRILEGSYVISADDQLQVIPVKISGMDPAFLGHSQEQLGYRYQDSAISGQLKLKRKPSRFNARSWQTLAVQDGQLALDWQTHLQITGGGLREVTVELRRFPDRELEFQPLNDLVITEQQKTIADGKILWKLTFDRAVRGNLSFVMQAHLPHNPDTDSLTIPEIFFPAAELQEQYLAIAADLNQYLTVEIKDANNQIVETIEAAEIPERPEPDHQHSLNSDNVHSSRIVFGYHLRQPGFTGTMTEKKYDPLPVPMAIGNQLELASVLADSGHYHQQVQLRFSVSGVQSLLFRLPESATLWSVSIDQRPVVVRQKEGVYVIPLQFRDPDESQQLLTIQYGGEVQPLSRQLISEVVLPTPEFAVLTGGGSQQPLPVLGAEGVVYHSPNSRVELMNAGWENKDQAASDDWITNLRNYWHSLTLNDFLWNLIAGSFLLLVPIGLLEGLRRAWRLRSPLLLIMAIGLGIFFSFSLLLISGFYMVLSISETASYLPAPSGEGASSEDFSFQFEPEAVNAPAMEGVPTDRPLAAAPPVVREGLLSLPLTFSVPEQFEAIHFRTLGNPLTEQGLQIQSLSKNSVQNLQWVIISGLFLLFWVIRNSSRKLKWSLLFIVFGLSAVLWGVLPVYGAPLWQGLCWGGVLGVLLWGLLSCCRGCCSWFCLTAQRWSSATALWLGVSVALCAFSEVVFAADGKPAPSAVKKTVLYFPYQTESSPLAMEKVFVPQAEYRKLWEAAHPEESTSAPPVKYQISEANHVASLRVASDQDQSAIQIQSRFVIHSYHDQPQWISLPIDSEILESLMVNGQPLSSRPTEKKQSAVLISSPGIQVVDATFLLPTESLAGAGEFTVALQPVPSGSLSFALPQADLQLTVNDGKIPYQLVTREDQQLAEIAIARGGLLTLQWQPKLADRADQFLSCESTREVLIDEAGVELQYTFRFQVAQGSFSEVEFKLPASAKLKGLAGKELAGWQSLEPNRLRVLFTQAIEKQTEVTLSFFSPQKWTEDLSAFTPPDVLPQGVTREVGTWGIQWDAMLEVRLQSMRGVRQLASQQWNSLAATPLVKAPQRLFRFTERPQEIVLELTRQPAATIGQQFTLVDIQPHKLNLATLTKVELRGQPRLSLEFSLPAGFQVVELNATNLQDWFVTSSEERPGQLTVLFREPQTGAVQVFVRGYVLQSVDEGQQIALSPCHLTAATQLTSYFGIGAADLFGVNHTAQAGWQHLETNRLPAEMKVMASFPVLRAFTRTGLEMSPLELRVERLQAQMKGHSVAMIAVSDVSIDIGLSLQWTISQAASDRFSFLGPRWLEHRIEFEAHQIRQISTQPVGEDQLQWTIECQVPQSERYLASAVISLPISSDRIVRAPRLQFVQPESMPEQPELLEIQGHYALLVNRGKEPLEPLTQHAVHRVTAAELPIQVPEALVEQSIEILRLPNTLVPEWKLQPLPAQESTLATIFLADQTTVIDGTGFWRTEVIYQVKNRGRQFLPLMLPDKSELLSVFVKGQPSRSYQTTFAGKSVRSIPIPVTGAADLAFEVRVVVQGRLSQSLTSLWKSTQVTLPCPQVLSLQDSATEGVPVMHTIWKVSTPDGIAVELAQGTGTNMVETSRQAAHTIAYQSRLKELQELSQIVSLSSNSYRQRRQAAKNMKQLQTVIEKNKRSELLDQESLEKEAEILRESILQQQLLQQERKPSGDDEMVSRGRAFIQQNSAIILENELNSQSRSHSPSAPFGLKGEQRIQSPQFSEEMTEGQKQIRKQEDHFLGFAPQQQSRRLLLEENQRQSEQVLQSQQAQPPSAAQGMPQEPRSPNGLRPYSIHNQTSIMESPFEDTDALPDPAEELFIGPGGMGGMGGGFSIDFDEEGTEEKSALEKREIDGWTAAGGLSLPVSLTLYDQRVIFSKVGGQPELTIEVYSHEQFKIWFRVIWCVSLLGFCGWLLIQHRRLSRGERVPGLGMVLVIGGLLGFLFLPNLGALVGIAAAMLGAIYGWWMRTKPLTAAEELV